MCRSGVHKYEVEQPYWTRENSRQNEVIEETQWYWFSSGEHNTTTNAGGDNNYIPSAHTTLLSSFGGNELPRLLSRY